MKQHIKYTYTSIYLAYLLTVVLYESSIKSSAVINPESIIFNLLTPVRFSILR